jgi:predicted polyphosphate/ATP-dependent NAD kinase
LETGKLGLIVNPIAGMGGRVGLKGTDGHQILSQAIKLGAQPQASTRAAEALSALAKLLPSTHVETVEGTMGEESVRKAGLPYEIVTKPETAQTSPKDTEGAARVMRDRHVALLLFAGGDGTAVDILHSVDGDIPVLGVPAGVKMFSGVFATSPNATGGVVAEYLQGQIATGEGEVLDINEEDYRRGILSPRLVGVLRIPASRWIQSGKEAVRVTGDESLVFESIARYLQEETGTGASWVLGPGTTVAAISRFLGVEKTLLGVDILKPSGDVLRDVNERQLIEISGSQRCLLVLSPIGRQGFLLGRGNQQISPRVIQQIGPRNIRIVATRSKLLSIDGRRLLVDTGEAKVDESLRGYGRVIVGYREEVVFPIH